jgi:L-lactate permease
MIAPAKVILECAPANLEGSERIVIRRILFYGKGLILIIGFITSLFSAIGAISG